MKCKFWRVAVVALALSIGSAWLQIAYAQSFSPAQRGEIERIIHDYLIRNPEVLKEVIAEGEKRQAAAQAEKNRVALAKNAKAMFSSPHQVTIANPAADVTLVQFFDYNCGFCKHALGDMIALLKTDPKLRVVLKEFPVLGEGSVEAAKVAVAVRMQDHSGGKRYFEFYKQLLGGRGAADKARALAAAKQVGFDVGRIEKDLTSPEIRTTLEESFKLADAVGINGTPSFVVGHEVVIGAVGLPALRKQISLARCGKPSC